MNMIATTVANMLQTSNFAVVVSASASYDMATMISETWLTEFNTLNTSELITALDHTGLKYMHAEGVYEGVSEKSFIVFCDDYFDVARIESLGNKHDQECVLVLDLNKDRAMLKYCDSVSMIGSHLRHVDTSEGYDNYSVISGDIYIVE